MPRQLTLTLSLKYFTDDNRVDSMYCPAPEISGYGHILKEALDFFEFSLKETLDHFIRKKIVGQVAVSGR